MNNAPDNSSALFRSPPVTRKKRLAACERCHRRRTRCDASITGTPCSECKRSNSEFCNLVHSKRTRGPGGRYILPEQNEPQTTDASGNLRTTEKSEVTSTNITKSAQNPEVPLNLARLVGAEEDSDESGGKSGSSSPKPSMHDSRTMQQDARANFVGESWYASYVLSTSAAGHAELHRSLGRRRSKGSSECPSNLSSQTVGRNSNNIFRRVPPLDLPPQSLTERLLEAYFKRFHAYCPILDKRSFLSSLGDGTVSITLLRSVLYVASVHCESEILHLMGYSTRIDAGDDFFNKACSSFDSDVESDRTTMVLSSYLLHYHFGKPTSYRDTLWWLGNAIRSAQCMGYHRSTKHSKMSQKDKSQWKRIWWCLYIRDRQVCLSAGPPMSINDLDCDVEDLTMDDFPDETPETAQYIIAQASLSNITSNMFYCHCSPSRLSLSRDPSIRQAARRDIQTRFEEWYRDEPLLKDYDEHHHLTLTLKVCYHYYIINLQQRLQRLCPRPFLDSHGSGAILAAAGEVTTLVEESLLYWTPEHFPMIYISAIFTAMTAHVAECGTSGAKRDQLSQKLRPCLLALKQFEQCYNLARWIKNMFMDIITRRPSRPVIERRRYEASTSKHNVQNANGNPAESVAQEDIDFVARDDSTNNTLAQTAPSQENRYLSGDSGSTSQDLGALASACTYDHGSLDPSLESPLRTSTTPLENFMPNFTDSDFPDPQYNEDLNVGFPSPSSLEWQHLRFLADLGLPTFSTAE